MVRLYCAVLKPSGSELDLDRIETLDSRNPLVNMSSIVTEQVMKNIMLMSFFPNKAIILSSMRAKPREILHKNGRKVLISGRFC